MSTYPSRVAGANIQDETNDVPGNDQIVNARDYNIHDREIRAIEEFIGTSSDTSNSTVVGKVYKLQTSVNQLSQKVDALNNKPYGPDAIVDSLGDGTHTSIQSALADLPATGGWIHVHPGLFILSDPVSFYGDASGKSVLITGCGNATMLEVAKNTTGFIHKLPSTMIVSNLDMSVSSGSTSSNGFDMKDSSGVLVLDNVNMTGMQKAITVQGVGCRLFVKNSMINGSTISSIDIDSATSSSYISNCRINHTATNGTNVGTGILFKEGNLYLSSVEIISAVTGISITSSSSPAKNSFANMLGLSVSYCTTPISVSGPGIFAYIQTILQNNTTNTITDTTSAPSVVHSDVIPITI